MTGKKRIVYIDGDIIGYSCGFASEGEPVSHALNSAKKLIQRVIRDTNADDYLVCLSGEDNFRDDVAKLQPYKGNRKGVSKPEHHAAIIQYIKDNYTHVISDNEEADDLMGIFQTADLHLGKRHPIIATRDKDLNMIEGEHYDWVKEETTYVYKKEADRFFAVQLLTGDAVDNIPGLKRTTGQIATKALKEYVAESDDLFHLVRRVLEVYAVSLIKHHGDDWEMAEQLAAHIVEEIGQLLWIRRHVCTPFTDYLDLDLRSMAVANPTSKVCEILGVEIE